ncbi:uncharacterized protein LOC124711156 [Schistocerca piceifrons]|uniref:uncharacterized protein LOC124711156 n=1 Tax=Schistocerca piceifrons TaxID=274613 RepID=UPI001F5FF2B5|nr:uncharacterized protein LOC124711156 [Schistocerca piceifrons]
MLSFIKDDIMPQCLRNAIRAEEKLYLTVRFLATGESYQSLSFAYRISPSYISRGVKNVLKILRIRLLPMLMLPSTESDFRRIEEEFWLKCNTPNGVGAIDGKHGRIRAPERSGYLLFNCKDFFQLFCWLLWTQIVNSLALMSALTENILITVYFRNRLWARK